MDDCLDDLEELVRLAEAAPSSSARRSGRSAREVRGAPPEAQDAPPPQHAEVQGVPPLPDLEDLAMVIAVGNAQPQRRHERRSWQAAEHARNAKALKLAKAKADKETSEREAAEAKLVAVAEQFPTVARVCGVGVRRGPMTAARAATLQRLAFQPTARSHGATRLAQSRAAAVVADCAADLQAACVEQRWSARNQHQGEAPGSSSGFRAEVLAWQWDETTQKLKMHTSTKALQNERLSQAPVSKQIMMQNGLLTSVLATAAAVSASSEPMLCKGLLLETQNRKTILEGLRRCIPFKFDDPAFCSEVAGHCDAFILSFCCDRAATNMAVLRDVWTALQSAGMPSNLFPFVEFCAAHGVALVKGRPQVCKHLVAVSHTLSGCFRQWGFANAFREALIRIVGSKLTVKHEARPAGAKARALSIIETLFGNADSEHLHKTTSDGRRIPTLFYAELLDLAAVVDLGAAPAEMWTHWCCVEQGSELHSQGHAVGAPCCGSRTEAVEQIAATMLNVLLHRQWSQSAVSRWTYVGVTMRKIALGLLSYRVLPECLSEMQALWGATGNIAQLLERLLAADHEDFQARSKLRLMRCCQTFVPLEASWKIGILLVILRETDKLLYAILGDGTVSSRAGLAKLVDEGESPIATLLHQLLLLLRGWSAGAPLWQVLTALGGDFGADGTRRWARQMILHTGSGVFDYFEQRMGHAPFTLFKIGDSRVRAEVQRSIADRFLRTPDHCLSPFGRALTAKCSTVEALLVLAPHIMRSLDAGSAIAIDLTERAHASLRVDLRSTGTAANFAAGINRFFCQQLRAEHQSRCGEDPAAAPPPLAGAGAAAQPPESKRRRVGGNARMECHNHKLRAHKQRVAPDRSLTAAELAEFEDKFNTQWNQMDLEEQAAWEMVWTGSKIQRRAEAVVARDAIVQERGFSALWGASGAAAATPVPPAMLVDKHQHIPSAERRAMASRAPQQTVGNDCQELLPEETIRVHSLCGCVAEKKNVCRHTLGEELRDGLDSICGLLNRTVDSLGVESARTGEHLLLLQAEQEPAAARAEGGEALQAIVLLVDPCYRPKCQILAWCGVRDKSHGLVAHWDVQAGTIVSLLERDSSLSRRFRTVHFTTSDDFGMELARRSRRWSLQELSWRFPDDAANLLDMQIESIGAVFRPPERATAARRANEELAALNILDAGDPFEMGRAAARRLNAEPARAPDGERASQQPADIMSDIVDWQELPADLLQDVLREAEQEEGALAEGGDAGFAMEGDDVAGEASADEADCLEAVEAEGEAERRPPSPAELRGSCHIDGRGYVTSPHPPWAGKHPGVGRLTTWPESKPVERRSVSMRCYLHPKCVTPARVRTKVSDDLLLRWLFGGCVPETGASRAREEELGKEHRALFSRMIAEPAEPPPLAGCDRPGRAEPGSGGGAPSSSGGAALS